MRAHKVRHGLCEQADAGRSPAGHELGWPVGAVRDAHWQRLEDSRYLHDGTLGHRRGEEDEAGFRFRHLRPRRGSSVLRYLA